MKKRYRMAAVCIGMTLTICGCKAEPVQENVQPWQQETTEREETPEEQEALAKQAKLAAIDPSAYGNIDGLEALEPGTYFSVIGKNDNAQYWKAVEEGAQAAVEDLNEALNLEGADKLKFVYSGPAASDRVTEQVNILDEELARYPAAVAIAIIDSKSCLVQFDMAEQNGIPIVTFDSASTYQGTMANISTDNPKAAAEAAVHMAEALQEDGQILVFSYDSKSVTSHERVDSFVEEIRTNHPGMSVTETYYLDQFEELKKRIVKEQTEEEEPDDGEENPAEENLKEEDLAEDDLTDEDVYAYIFEQNPDIKGIYATNGQTVLRMAELAEAYDRDVVIMGYDADTEEIEALREGRVAGLIAQNPYGMGYAAVVAEARCVLELGNEAEIDTGYLWVTADNVDDTEVQRMLY